MSRIIAGAAGGIPLFSVPGTATRPTTDRVKEALFSRLDAYEVIADAKVLDLYAGSGSLGVESASRGAKIVDLVESGDKAAAVSRTNADLVNKTLNHQTVRVHHLKVETYLDRVVPDDYWDLVLMDPPYSVENETLTGLLETLVPHLAEGAVVVLERSSRSQEPEWPNGMERFAEKKYGETKLWFAEPSAAAL
ncbi:16S rRNA (guanine(966)-N(2))-methyltransferase RsmD [Arthrobacter sp. HLT1-21]